MPDDAVERRKVNRKQEKDADEVDEENFPGWGGVEGSEAVLAILKGGEEICGASISEAVFAILKGREEICGASIGTAETEQRCVFA